MKYSYEIVEYEGCFLLKRTKYRIFFKTVEYKSKALNDTWWSEADRIRQYCMFTSADEPNKIFKAIMFFGE